jgi:hypothetical protein
VGQERGTEESALDCLGKTSKTKVRDGRLDFPDMWLFNQVLLAQQAWRLIMQFSDSLCAQLLKAKYYPQGELVDTVFSEDASHTWRSIEYGLELLKKGIIWRVGLGSKIQIWRDPWIPRPPSRKLMFEEGARSFTVGRRKWPGTMTGLAYSQSKVLINLH